MNLDLLDLSMVPFLVEVLLVGRPNFGASLVHTCEGTTLWDLGLAPSGYC